MSRSEAREDPGMPPDEAISCPTHISTIDFSRKFEKEKKTWLKFIVADIVSLFDEIFHSLCVFCHNFRHESNVSLSHPSWWPCFTTLLLFLLRFFLFPHFPCASSHPPSFRKSTVAYQAGIAHQSLPPFPPIFASLSENR